VQLTPVVKKDTPYQYFQKIFFAMFLIAAGALEIRGGGLF
jgi:hypothetical protein